MTFTITPAHLPKLRAAYTRMLAEPTPSPEIPQLQGFLLQLALTPDPETLKTLESDSTQRAPLRDAEYHLLSTDEEYRAFQNKHAADLLLARFLAIRQANPDTDPQTLTRAITDWVGADT
jgi:hypothetical protein